MRLRSLMLGATAVAGLIGAHVLDYTLLVPDPSHRHDVLLRTGHGYLPFVLAVAAIAGLAAVASALAMGARGSGRRSHPAWVMALVQGGGFVALEAVERLGAGARFDRSVIAVVLLGVVLQALVAFLATRVLGLLGRAGAILARALQGPPPEPRRVPRTIWFARSVTTAPRACLGKAHAVRGPPQTLFA